MKLLILSLLLASCATPKKSIDVQAEEIKVGLAEKQINALREDIRRLDYYIDHERCFTVYAICLGEKKKPQKECWAQHEACVIRVYKQWKANK